MIEIFGTIGTLAQGIVDVLGFIVPQAGVGGGVDVKESVDLATLLKFTIIFAASLAGLFGIGLAFAAQKFSVKVDPRVEQIKDVLAHAHCGACGYPGCGQYAEAVVADPNVSPSLCTPGGAKTAEAVARITGKVAEAKDPVFARIMCQGGEKEAERRFSYEGIIDCRAAVLAGGGDKSCIYGCLGYGTCSRACPFGAISMSADRLPVVDMKKCTGCGKCVVACPKKVIELIPAAKAVVVTCHSRDKGAQTRKLCTIGCIACGKCEKVCPYDAPHVENNLSRIDPAKCHVCGLCVKECPTSAIRDFITFRSKAFITDACIGCEKCTKVCPVDAPSGEKKKRHSIDQGKCIGCGICTENCPVQAIEGTINTAEVMAKAAAKKAAKEQAA
jgi:Na+-translocating ferredoxin:NAD+ oxidoreductase RNF subunit RnfB